MSDPSLLLIVRQRPVPHPELEKLVGELQGFDLDPYTTRQHLLGPGLAQLARGARSQLDSPAAALRRHGYPCWLIDPPRPAFAPPRLRSLVAAPGGIDFHCEGERRVRLERGTSAVGVLADLSGELAGRQARSLLARHAYLGDGQVRVFTPEEIRQAILKGQPVFDCYLLDGPGAVADAFRVLPGRFNPEGLGGRAGLGAVRNLEAVLELVGEYAGDFRLHTDFGLSQIPGCLPQPAGDDPAALPGNLDALTRYGWLVAILTDPPVPGSGSGGAAPAAVPAAGPAGAAALDEGGADRSAGTGTPAEPAILPPPPERPESRFPLRRALPITAALAGAALLAVAGRSELLRPVFHGAVRSGVLPGAAAVALCWGGFARLRLKRFIENTPTSRIRSLAMGLVEIRGRALRRYALVAPMTQGACVWYRLRKYRRDRNHRWTLTSESDSSHVPFLLDDGGGRVVVDPAGATVKARTEQTGFPGESTLIGAAVEGGAEEKWVEELIFEGTSLYVLGQARPARPAGPGLRARTVEVLRRLKLDPHALRRYDTNGDGRLDDREWQEARDDAEQLAAAGELAESGCTTGQVVLGKPPRGLPFLIAEGRSGAELAGSYGWSGAALLALGAAAFGLALKLALEFFPLF